MTDDVSDKTKYISAFIRLAHRLMIYILTTHVELEIDFNVFALVLVVITKNIY